MKAKPFTVAQVQSHGTGMESPSTDEIATCDGCTDKLNLEDPNHLSLPCLLPLPLRQPSQHTSLVQSCPLDSPGLSPTYLPKVCSCDSLPSTVQADPKLGQYSLKHPKHPMDGPCLDLPLGCSAPRDKPANCLQLNPSSLTSLEWEAMVAVYGDGDGALGQSQSCSTPHSSAGICFNTRPQLGTDMPFEIVTAPDIPTVLNIIQGILQLTAEALNLQYTKMDTQIKLLNTLAVFTSGIDSKIADLNNLIVRAQNSADSWLPACPCICSSILDKLSSLPGALSSVFEDLKRALALRLASNPMSDNPLQPSITRLQDTSLEPSKSYLQEPTHGHRTPVNNHAAWLPGTSLQNLDSPSILPGSQNLGPPPSLGAPLPPATIASKAKNHLPPHLRKKYQREGSKHRLRAHNKKNINSFFRSQAEVPKISSYTPLGLQIKVHTSSSETKGGSSSVPKLATRLLTVTKPIRGGTSVGDSSTNTIAKEGMSRTISPGTIKCTEKCTSSNTPLLVTANFDKCSCQVLLSQSLVSQEILRERAQESDFIST
ncbi:hypothetical protein NDU88_007424 [Pleurodeles waltl]|uniref:Uncharacterized protein n=1 Tax=Pleurodeles waltl TaxID=8319 RepID=A0AAV7QRV1_PLEWA|nr:hypothetical protein NDU88_007424 [Pleurodeles waltl]